MHVDKVIALGGDSSLSCRSKHAEGIETKIKPLKILPLIFKLIWAFLRYGNQEVYYHLCFTGTPDTWDCPMEAENVEVRHTACGKKVTIW